MNFLMKKMMKRQLKGLPPDQQDKFMKMIEKDPKFFTELAKEIEVETKKGKDQQAASLAVMMKHKKKLQELMK
ncbi:MAG: hypothetical protein ACI9GH_000415 [Candidatus Paceibacteria bacterium]|jgi:hypothetical protein